MVEIPIDVWEFIYVHLINKWDLVSKPSFLDFTELSWCFVFLWKLPRSWSDPTLKKNGWKTTFLVGRPSLKSMSCWKSGVYWKTTSEPFIAPNSSICQTWTSSRAWNTYTIPIGIMYANPRCSMYGIFYLHLISFMVNVGKYTSPIEHLGMSFGSMIWGSRTLNCNQDS